MNIFKDRRLASAIQVRHEKHIILIDTRAFTGILSATSDAKIVFTTNIYRLRGKHSLSLLWCWDKIQITNDNFIIPITKSKKVILIVNFNIYL